MKRLAIYLTVLQALDVGTTMRGLGLGGAQESNHLGTVLLPAGWVGLAMAKMVATTLAVLFAWILWRGSPTNRVQAKLVLQGACTVMVGVVGWNAWIGMMH